MLLLVQKHPIWYLSHPGSLKGPCWDRWFTSYTRNELTETSKNTEECHDLSHLNNNDLFGSNCLHCGSMTTFADDATIVTARKIQIGNYKKDLKKPLRCRLTSWKQICSWSIKRKLPSPNAWLSKDGQDRHNHNLSYMWQTKTVTWRLLSSPAKIEYWVAILGKILSWSSHLLTGEKGSHSHSPKTARIPETAQQERNLSKADCS